jgi:hypothetical protein
MASENAKAVAREVIETVRKGKKVNKGAIIRKHGYAKSVSVMPQKVTETKSYKEEIAPIVLAMEQERDAAIKAMKKKRSKAKYRDMVDAVDKLTKNIQLLTGGKTSNDELVMRWGNG